MRFPHLGDDAMQIAADLVNKLVGRKMRLAVAESCTGGLLAGKITSIAGASLCFDRGYVTYSKEAKSDMLDIPKEVLEDKGQVSEVAAILMADSARASSGAQMGCSITGVAGPGSDSEGNPQGLVFIAVSLEGSETYVKRFLFNGDREHIRDLAVSAAIEMMTANL